MFNLRSAGIPGVSALLGGVKSEGKAALPPIKQLDIETNSTKVGRTLKHLVKANHVNHSILYSPHPFHNHLPHAIGAAYLFSPEHCTTDHLNAIYDDEKTSLEEWDDSPSEIARHDWQTNLGKEREYQRAYVDFFEDELVRNGYDWKQLVLDYLLDDQNGPPLIHGVLGGLAHPAIHLGYAFELGSKDVATEGLGLVACCWPSWHKYFDEPYKVPAGLDTTSDLRELLRTIREDVSLDHLLSESGEHNLETLEQKKEAEILDYWHRWEVKDAVAQLKDCLDTAILLLVSAHRPGKPAFDFFLCHLLTGLWGARILWSQLPTHTHTPLLRQWWMLVVRIYIAQRRPALHPEYIEQYKAQDWRWVEHKGLKSMQAKDPHYVKALRVMRDCDKLFSSDDDWYLKAASKFGNEFEDWVGFGRDEQEDSKLDIKP